MILILSPESSMARSRGLRPRPAGAGFERRVVQGHQQLALERAEHHAVAGVFGVEGLFFLEPGACELARGRVGNALGVTLIAPA